MGRNGSPICDLRAQAFLLLHEPIRLRENELALSDGRPTRRGTVSRNLARNRLATVRKRLMVGDKSRPRGPARSSLESFLGTPRARSEGAALASLCTTFEIPIDRNAASLPTIISLDFTERLCETYEAFRACFPNTELDLEES